jgi:hypothetical protein
LTAGAQRLRRVALCALVAVLVSACGSGGPRSAAVPPDFLGLVSNEVFAAAPAEQAQLLASERHAGVELLRQTFDWAAIEPQPGVYDFARYDAFMTATTRARMRVLAVLNGTPAYAAPSPAPGQPVSATTELPPANMAAFARFAAVLAARYGPGGAFWRAHPDLRPLPIRSWQVWNEPNFPVYWGGHPNAGDYAAMLRAVYGAIHGVDKHAEIVTAGIANSTIGIGLERYLHELLAAHAPFDTLAIHPYASSANGVIAAVTQVRRMLDGAGRYSTPIWVSEFGWASGGPPSSFTVGPTLQARYVLDVIVTLAREAGTLHVRGVVYFDWRDDPPYPGQGDFWGLHTGLVARDGIAKPALSAYYQAAGVVRGLP